MGGIIVYTEVITERKQAEDALRLSQEQYRALVENINDVIFTLDLQGTFTFVSPAIERLLGYTTGEVEGLPFSRFVHPDDLSGLAEAFTQTASGIRAAHEFRVLDKKAEEEIRRLNVELVVASGMTAAADPALLRLVLVQLLDNAWKFTSKHDAARIEVGVSDADGERVFFVRDDGAGVNMDYAKRLFGAFRRFHAAGEFEGDGIGLAMVQRLVLRHGGRAWAGAEVDKGATFYFTLPEAELAAD